VTDARLTATVISPTNGPSSGVTTTAVMSGSAVLGIWDGRNDDGAIVNNGQYYIELRVQDGKGGNGVVDLPVAVLSDRTGGQQLVVKQNVMTRENPVAVVESGVLGGTVNAKVYSLTGVLVRTLTGVPGTGQVSLDSAGLASGVYILVGDVKDADGKLKETFKMKAMVVR
jgi:hypothetical protein